ncbi:MAG: hypothetical protein ABI690_27400 [Chloroflexota bacterium]
MGILENITLLPEPSGQSVADQRTHDPSIMRQAILRETPEARLTLPAFLITPKSG